MATAMPRIFLVMVLTLLVAAPAAMATRIAKATAAAPSFNRLSDSTTMARRGWTFISLNVAITETGSVAAISTPNRADPSKLQPSPK